MLVWIARIVTEMGLVEKRGFVLLAGLELRDQLFSHLRILTFIR